LNERECSIQRRNQKVIEEAPSSFLTPEVRRAMGEQAVALCKKVGYVSAGTVEFLVDSQRNFYFLEMNTRLQVEHPITEYITGLDLVEWMIKIAAGEKIPFTQNEVQIKGWAMEARVYAEDPLRNFLPSIGRLIKYKEPGEGDSRVRVDSGILEGSAISVYYDPLICKLATHGETRQEAIDIMISALDNYVIRGVTHNVNFLRDTMTNKEFIAGNISTKFIPQHYPNGFEGHVLSEEEKNELVVLAASLHHLRAWRDYSISSSDSFFDSVYVVSITGIVYGVEVGVSLDSEKHFSVQIPPDFEDGESKTELAENKSESKVFTINLEDYQIDAPVITYEINEKRLVSQLINITDLGFDIQFMGTIYKTTVLTTQETELSVHMKEAVELDTQTLLVSPMAGTLISIAAKEGDVVLQGQEIAVVEAMKMQNVLKAERDVIIKSIKKQPGSQILLDEAIIEFEPEVQKEKTIEENM